jgi:serine/threonine protein kinase
MITRPFDSLADSFEHMLTVFHGPQIPDDLSKTIPEEVVAKEAKRTFIRHERPLLTSSKFTLFAGCKESKKGAWKKYALLSPLEFGIEPYSEECWSLHNRAVEAGIALKIQKYVSASKRGYFLPFSFYGDLYQFLLNAEDLSEEAKVLIAKKIIELVSQLHQLNIAHQDIKLENILVDKEGSTDLRFYLHNFSFATENETSTVLCGSENYLALDHNVSLIFRPKLRDIFSLGVLLFSLFTKKMWREEKDSMLLEWEKHPLIHRIQIEQEYEKILFRHSADIPKKFLPVLKGFFKIDPYERTSLETAKHIISSFFRDSF